MLIFLAVALLGAAVGAPLVAASARQADGIRVGTGDPRSGYESSSFETRSRALKLETGTALDLAGLARNPPLGLPSLTDPPDSELINLGRRLFFDRRLSANETLSCGMCHVPEQAFAQNELATPVGFEGAFVRRNAPSIYNVAYLPRLFHDGRESSLVAQIWSPLLADNEMGNGSRAEVLERIRQQTDYADAFAAVFPNGLTEATLGEALAGYQRALLSGDSPFDRWFYAGDGTAMSPAAKRGFFVFTEAGCQRCHAFDHKHALFTDHGAHRTGVEFASREREATPPSHLQLAPGVRVPLAVSVPAPDRQDEGLMEITGNAADRWRYRTPGLRNVALTAPYMHDGSLRTLAAVVAFYNDGAGGDPGRDQSLVPLGLSAGEQADLVAWLEALTGSNVDALAADARSAPIGDRGASNNAGPAAAADRAAAERDAGAETIEGP
ncbi:MAG: cytochrome c peroxidase [Pseudomonadota bacterium]